MNDETTTSTSAVPDTRRQRFAAWRRDRPFWAGVLTVASGLILWFSGRLQFDNFEVQLGIEGMQSTLLPVALVALGVLLTTQPQFRVFYGVITLAISVYSLLGVNLGGFGVGMILGVVGGILAVSWMPSPAPEAGGDVDQESGDQEDGVADPAAFEDLLPFEEEQVKGGRHAAVVAAVAVLALGGTGVTATGSTMAAAAATAAPSQVRTAECWDPLGWLEWACGDDEPSPSPSPSATDDATGTAPTEGTGSDGGTGGIGGTDGAADLLDPGATGGTTAPGADEGQQPDDTGDAEPAGKDAGKDPAQGDAEPLTDAEAQKEVEKAARLELGPCARITFGGGHDINVSLPGDCGKREDAHTFSLDGELETRDLQLPLTGLNGIDVVNVPVTHDGPRRDALRISVDSVKVPGFWLKTYADNDGKLGGTVTDADYVSMEGNAQMYISSIHANLPDGDDFAELGAKIADGASLVEMLLGLVDARIGLMGATSDVQVWSGFREQVWEE